MDPQHPVLVMAAPRRLRDSLCAMLYAADKAVLPIPADDGNAGLRKLAEGRPLFVLMDADLLDDEGWGTLEAIKRGWPGVRCVVWAHSNTQVLRATNGGADDVLAPHFSLDSLRAVVEKARG